MLNSISFDCLSTGASRRVVVVRELDLREPWVWLVHESLVVCGWLYVQSQITRLLPDLLCRTLLALLFIHSVTVCSERGKSTNGYSFFIYFLRMVGCDCKSIA